MSTTKEIADALRTAKVLDLAALRGAIDLLAAQRDAGTPIDLIDAVISAACKVQEATDALRRTLGREAAERSKVAALLASAGAQFDASAMQEQSTDTSAVQWAVLAERRAALVALLDVFVAVGDRIVATPEEQANAAAERAERETVTRRTAWEKLPVKRLRDAAKWRGLDVGGDKSTLAQRLVDAGMTPEQASE